MEYTAIQVPIQDKSFADVRPAIKTQLLFRNTADSLVLLWLGFLSKANVN
jgi:hypothetical protein